MKKPIQILLMRGLWLLLIALWIGFIFFNSAQPASSSSQSSNGVLDWLNALMASLHLPIRFSSFFVRKAAHFMEYTFLGFLLMCGVFRPRIRALQVLGGCAFGIAVAFVDEGIQFFQEGRSAQFSDVLLDSCGVIFGIGSLLLLRFLIIRIVFSKRNHKKQV